MKRCPFCAEEIQETAIRCRYCHADFPVDEPGVLVWPLALGFGLLVLMIVAVNWPVISEWWYQ